MNKIFSLSIIAAASLAVFSSCDTNVDLTAPYASTTVVFGLLDPQADTQFVKITKTFLGDGNLNDYAMIRDSSEYKWEEFSSLRVEEYATGNPNPVATHDLQPITIQNKDVNGIFYGPEQTVYYFPTPVGGLNTSRKYKLVADFTSRPDIFAWTNVIPANVVDFQSPQSGLGLGFATTTFTGAINYNEDCSIRWSRIDNAEIYDLAIRFYYKEYIYQDNSQTQLIDTVSKSIDWKIGTFNSADLDLNNGYYNLTFNAESFFSFLGNNLTADPRIRREAGRYTQGKTRAFELRMGMANDELKTWINVNNPVTGIIQERPSYTNVVNGLGLFASRATAYVLKVPLEASTGTGNINALINGIYTADLNFCDPNPSNIEFGCN
jgi:hypothetical protein